MMMSRLTVALLAVILGMAMGKMTKEMYELKWEAIQRLASGLYDVNENGERGDVSLTKLEEFATSGLEYIGNHKEHPHEGPLWDLYNQLETENTELGQCLGNLKEAKYTAMKWMGAMMFSGLKCKIQQFRDTLLQTDCAKASMKECVPEMLGKVIMAKKMMHKTKYAAKMMSLTCSADPISADGTSFFQAGGIQAPTEHHIKGPMCMMAAFSNMMDDDNEKGVCDCMRKEFSNLNMTIPKAMFQVKLGWFRAVAEILKPASAVLPSLPELPEELKRYDPFVAAQCVVKHCTTNQINGILKMTGLMDAVKAMGDIKRYFGEEMIGMAQRKCSCMQEFANSLVEDDSTKQLPKIFVRYPEICTNTELMKNVLGMGGNRVEQDRQCADHIIHMLERTLKNMPDDEAPAEDA